MTSLSLEWKNFSQTYLPDIEKSFKVKRMNQALNAYLSSRPEIDLSFTSKRTLKLYAFQKAGQVFSREAVLSQESAAKIFQFFQHAISNLQGELTTQGEFIKAPKPNIPKGLERLAAVSATVREKYIEPHEKANVQSLLNQIEKIDQVVKPIFNNDPHLNPNTIATLELLAKKLAYLNPKNGEKYQITHEGRTVEYRAQEMHLWMGMFAYGFAPTDPNDPAPPILVFSGTRLAMSSRGSLATITADFDPRGVGHVAYQNGKKVISQWLNAQKNQAVITGHSLGGALARYAAIDNSHKVEKVFTFSAPGISSAYGKKWTKLNQDPLAKKPIIYNFNHSEDKVPTFGQSYVGTSFQVICAVEKTVNKKLSVQRSIHIKRLFGRKVSLLCKTYPTKGLKTWQQQALSTIPFIVCMALLFISRALFGIHTSKPYTSLFGPLRWGWRELITNKFAAKYALPDPIVV